MSQASEGRNVLERITFFTGLLVLVGLCGYLIYQITQKSSGPPELKIIRTYQPKANEYSFEVQVENMGQTTAEGARIQLELYQDGKSVEKTTLAFKYIPSKSKESGWAVFNRERKPGDSLVISGATFVKP